MILTEKILLRGIITLETGLHIGGSKATMDIGGLDSPVIKTPMGVPYIPGSSLKGKLRTLLAKKEGSNEIENDSDILKKMFGYADKTKGVITRLIFRDAYLDKEAFTNTFKKETVQLETEYSEAKWENKIDRRKGTAGNPRQIERIPAGAQFNFEIVLDVYDEAEKKEILAKLKEGFDLLLRDYLGGNGTRGYGKITVEFSNESKKYFS